MQLLIELGVAPALAALSALAGRRFGQRVGGVVSAFPAIVGPVLLLAALEHGTAFAARAANGTLLGLIALSGFALGYGRVAAARGWPLSLAAGWACAAAGSLPIALGAGRLGPPAGLLVAVVSIALAQRGLPRIDVAAAPPPPRGSIPARMALTALLVWLLAGAASSFGAVIGGMLAALPVLASVLAVFDHREAGGAAAVTLLHGMLVGMAGFVSFCELLALLIGAAGTWPALATATLAALLVQSLTVGALPRELRAARG